MRKNSVIILKFQVKFYNWLTKCEISGINNGEILGFFASIVAENIWVSFSIK